MRIDTCFFVSLCAWACACSFACTVEAPPDTVGQHDEQAILVNATCAAGDGCLITGCATPDPDCGFPPPGGGGGGDPGGSGPLVKMLTYNIKHGAVAAADCNGGEEIIDLDAVAEVIRDADPHVVCLQEVDRNATRSDLVHQASYLLDAVPSLGWGVYAAVGTYAQTQIEPYVSEHPELVDCYENTLGTGGKRGLAVLSRFPITAYEKVEFVGDTQPRAHLLVEIAAPNRTVYVACTHFSHNQLRDGQDVRVTMAEWLVDNAPASDAAFVLGDLNSTPGSTPVSTLLGAFETATPTPILTIPASAPNKQFDYVMSKNSGAISVEAAAITTPQPSDHLPLLATYELP